MRANSASLIAVACALNVPVQYFFEGWAESAQTVTAQTAEPVEAAANDAATTLAIYAADQAAARDQRYRQSIR